jgi:hypothetical protein
MSNRTRCRLQILEIVHAGSPVLVWPRRQVNRCHHIVTSCVEKGEKETSLGERLIQARAYCTDIAAEGLRALGISNPNNLYTGGSGSQMERPRCHSSW